MATKPATSVKATKTKRAALYARISEDDDGRGKGVERQRADMRKLAKREGWAVVEYIDNDKSASRYAKKRRKDFDRMLADVQAGHVDVILVADLSRYTREPRIVEDLIDLAEMGAVELVSLSGGEYDVNTPEGKMRLRNESTFSAAYSDFISHKTKIAKRHMIEQGDGPGGTRAFGYKGPHDKVTKQGVVHVKSGKAIEPGEATAYRKAVEDVLAGATLISIARRWNAQGFTTPRTRSPWGVPSVRACLTNPTHAGLVATAPIEWHNDPDDPSGKRKIKRYARRREIVGDGNWPAIITRAQHERIVAMIHDPNRRKRNPPRRSLLTSLVFCDVCGEPLRRNPRYYRCHRLPDRPDACGTVTVAAAALDELITNAAYYRLGSPTVAKALQRPKRRKRLGEDPATVQAELDGLAEAVGRGEMTPREVGIARKGIDARLAAARAAQHADDDNGTAALSAFVNVDIAKTWAELDLDRRRAVLHALIERITIKPGVNRHQTFDASRISVEWKA